MAKAKRTNSFLFKAIVGGIIVVVIVFLFSATAILIANNSKKVNPNLHKMPSGSNNELRVYVVSGKIIDIQDKTIIIETPVFDLAKNRWDNNKTEIRRLTTGNETELLKLSYRTKEKKKELELVSEKIQFIDLKIGDRIQANYSETVVEIKDFSPTLVTILLD